MITTQAGLALSFSSFLGLLVGAVVQVNAICGHGGAQREYATLRAMGIPLALAAVGGRSIVLGGWEEFWSPRRSRCSWPNWPR